jgi:hypothetical protein
MYACSFSSAVVAAERNEEGPRTKAGQTEHVVEGRDWSALLQPASQPVPLPPFFIPAVLGHRLIYYRPRILHSRAC